ncbi:DsbE family thiol:disulfide interchange protein [Mangrovimicrobium sediminis]|uniref:DsbE family thiol:disulfide interchange protein n=1 Tax=Mangrovimicrobium sediminis TaxID=2562682 RepID=A0A4Z0M714_9GAMM|nr:DsbE family thiol:disulfide interchange protein [Haliea sp. SAOS-164]TGD75198.1 DsbE family thiol:disulfide interchange protein [Haliea sp. SAOS-164]
MPARLKLFLPLIIFAVLALFLVRGLQLDPRELPSALIDRPFPEFSLPALAGGATLDKAAVTGRPALFNVWATWCPTCRVEHPFLIDLARRGVPVYGINYKDQDEPARQWLRDLGDPYTAVIVDREGTLGLDLGVYGAPETYLVDGDGVVRYRHVGVVDDTVWSETLGPLYRQYGGEGGQ